MSCQLGNRIEKQCDEFIHNLEDFFLTMNDGSG